jgi:N-acyl homoserine lactone hydrolase
MTTMSRGVPALADPVEAVSVISTGTVRIHPEQLYRIRQPLYRWLVASRLRTLSRPINVYVIERARGRVLFGTGQERASVTDALALQQPALVVLPAHDPTAARRLLAD